MLNKNEFGNLVKSYREQRGWAQEELASRWGFTRAYVSQIERGARKLDNMSQVMSLADILGIPQAKLEAIGRGIPQRKIAVKGPEQVDSAILQMLLAPGRDMVQLAYLQWVADQSPLMEEKLIELTTTLDQALILYHGELVKPAQQLLAYAHHMRARMALDRLDIAAAGGHLSEMAALGDELGDSEIIAMAMIYQANLLRKRGRFETSIRCFEAAKPYVEASNAITKGTYYENFSIVYADSGQEGNAIRTIDQALEIASTAEDNIASLANDFSFDGALWQKASNLSELLKPECLAIYAETDKLKPFRPMRERGAHTIGKGNAHLKFGNLEEGIPLLLQGIELAAAYGSKRQLGWVEKGYNRARLLPVGKSRKMNDLRDSLANAKKKVEGF